MRCLSSVEGGWRERFGWASTPGSEAILAAVTGERVFHRTFLSEQIGQEVSYHIFVPVPYDQQPEANFPVIYFLHGGGGGLEGVLPLSQHYAAAMREGLLAPSLVVFPNGLELSLWVDSYDGQVPMESVVIGDLIPHIDREFRTVADRDGRLVEGFSMGGYGAARFAFRYPHLFHAATLWGAGPLQPIFDHGPRGLDI